MKVFSFSGMEVNSESSDTSRGDERPLLNLGNWQSSQPPNLDREKKHRYALAWVLGTIYWILRSVRGCWTLRWRRFAWCLGS
jgi:hypothetical protein